jgi:uncharacterized protein
MSNDDDLRGRKRGRIWIDLDNTPHVPFFAPIIKELDARGYEVVITARDAYQTCELAALFRLRYRPVGRHYGKHLVLKVGGTLYRSLQLVQVIGRARAILAVSHGSRSQVLAARLMGIKSLALVDYEFADRSLISPNWILAPAVIPKSAFGASAPRVVSYNGIKEDIYVPGFVPDPSLKERLGLSNDDITVLLRPPATEAHYHSPENDLLFDATMNWLGRAPGVKVILLPRNSRQAAAVREGWPTLISVGKVRVLDQAEDGLNLIWHADLVISGGGTMNREAAAMGVPVYSIFRGQIGAVDRYLAKEGRLILLEQPADVAVKVILRRRRPESQIPKAPDTALEQVVSHILTIATHSDQRPLSS